MKRKLLLAASAIVLFAMSGLNFQLNAQVTDEEDEGYESPGVEDTVSCLPPTSNTCVRIHGPFGSIITRKGVPTLKL